MTKSEAYLKSVVSLILLSAVLSALLILSSCNFTFFLDGWENATYGTTAVDKALFLREAECRSKHKAGTLDLTAPDYFNQVNSVKYTVQHEGDNLYICFFGTDTPLDIYYDLVHWKEPAWTGSVAGVRVHAGFYRPYVVDPDGAGPKLSPADDIRNTVAAFLATGPADPRIYIAGHSAGGCHALISAFDLNLSYTGQPLDTEDRIYCLIGGAPAVGNSVFAAEFEARLGTDSCHRYVNGSDQMPSFLTPQAGFYQTGTPYRIGGYPNAMIAATGAWLGDHFIADYADSVRRLNP